MESPHAHTPPDHGLLEPYHVDVRMSLMQLVCDGRFTLTGWAAFDKCMIEFSFQVSSHTQPLFLLRRLQSVKTLPYNLTLVETQQLLLQMLMADQMMMLELQTIQ